MAASKVISGKFVEALFESDNEKPHEDNDDDGQIDPAPDEIESRINTVIQELGLANININYVLGDLKKTFGVDFSKRKDIRALIKDLTKKTVTFNDSKEIVPSSVAPSAGIVDSVIEAPPPPPTSPEIVPPVDTAFNVQQIAEIMEYIQTSSSVGKRLAEILNIKKRGPPSSKSSSSNKKAKISGNGRGKKSTKDRLVPRAEYRCTYINEPVERYCVKQRNRGSEDIYCAPHKYRVSKDPALAEKQEQLYKEHRVALDENAKKESGWIIPAGEYKPMSRQEFGKLMDGNETPSETDNANL